MAKFCTKCGKQLQDGEVCDCQNNSTSISAFNENSIWLEFKYLITNFWKNPISIGQDFVYKQNLVLALLFIAFQGIFSSIVGIIIDGKIIGMIESAVGSITSMFSTSVDINRPYLMVFIMTFLISVAFSFLLSVLMYAAYKVINIDVNFKTSIMQVSLRSFVICIFSVVSILFSFISIKTALFIFFISGVASIILITIFMAKQMDCKLNYYAITVAILIFVALKIFIMVKSVHIYMPSSIKSMTDILDLFSLY